MYSCCDLLAMHFSFDSCEKKKAGHYQRMAGSGSFIQDHYKVKLSMEELLKMGTVIDLLNQTMIYVKLT